MDPHDPLNMEFNVAPEIDPHVEAAKLGIENARLKENVQKLLRTEHAGQISITENIRLREEVRLLREILEHGSPIYRVKMWFRQRRARRAWPYRHRDDE